MIFPIFLCSSSTNLKQNPPYHSTCSPAESGQSLASRSWAILWSSETRTTSAKFSTWISITGHALESFACFQWNSRDHKKRIRLRQRQNPSSTLFLSPCCTLLTCDFLFFSSIRLTDYVTVTVTDWNQRTQLQAFSETGQNFEQIPHYSQHFFLTGVSLGFQELLYFDSRGSGVGHSPLCRSPNLMTLYVG